MKNILKSTLLLFSAMCVFTACESDRDDNPVLQTLPTENAFVLNTPAYSTSVVDLATTAEIPMTWSQPAYGYIAVTEYQLQVSKDGKFTKELGEVEAGEETTANYSILKTIYTLTKCDMKTNALSAALIKMNGWDENNVPEEATVYLRAQAKTKGSDQTVYSNVISMKVKPTVEVAASFGEWIYAPGNGQGWAPATAAALRSPEGDGIYTGYVYFDGEFKFTLQRGWVDEYNFEFFGTLPDGWTQGDGTNIKCPEEGVYFVTVDATGGQGKGTMKAVKITNMNLVGDYNGWTVDDATQQMTWNKDEMCYEYTGATVTANGWKFAANNGWGMNLGGTIDDLVQDGANLDVTGSTIKLYPLRNTSDKIYATVQ